MASGTNRAVLFSLSVLALAVASCGPPPPPPKPVAVHREAEPLPPLDPQTSGDLGESDPESQGIDAQALERLARAIDESHEPVFSFLISRHGKLVFEMYTSRIGRGDAHYMMSVTKSFTSALVGIAIDSHLIAGDEIPVSQALPPAAFGNAETRAKFDRVTVKDALAMSALDAPVFPHQKDEFARKRLKDFLASRNRLDFALSQDLLSEPGKSFLYTDVTPMLAIGMVTLASHETAFDFAKEHLFDPLGFRNEEWMHEDASGFDNGAFGLRIRPVDMQKFGLLYLHHGVWQGKQIVSQTWVDKSFSPWIRSVETPHDTSTPNYGYYWWTQKFGAWTAHVANGWKGQRIAVIPEADLVVTMTAYMEQGEEQRTFNTWMRELVAPAVHSGALPANASADAELARTLASIRQNSMRLTETAENRMIPSAAPKAKHRPFRR